MSPKSKVQGPKSVECAGLLAKPCSLCIPETTACSSLSLWERARVRGIELKLAQKTNRSNDLLQPFLRPKFQGQSQLASVTDFGLWTLDFGLKLNGC